MPNTIIKKKTKKQKQKQKQKQTVIVNINERARPASRRATPQAKRPPPPPPSSSIVIQSPKQNNDIRDLLFQFSKGMHTPDSIMTRTIHATRPNPQNEVILDADDESQLPNRPPETMTGNDAAIARLKGKAASSVYSFPETEEQTEDARRIRSIYTPPSIPLIDEYVVLTQPPEEIPTMNQSPPHIQVEAGTSGNDAELSKDLDEFFQYTKALGIRGPNDELLPQPNRAPTLAEKADLPVAESRFLLPEPPLADAEPVVSRAEAEKVDRRTHTLLQAGGFKNADEARDAIRKWNKSSDASDGEIHLNHPTKNGRRGGPKNIEDLNKELQERHLTFRDLKAYQTLHTESPNNTRGSSKIKQIKGQPLGSPLG